MDLSAGCRPSQSMSPALHPTIPSPPALIPLGKIERDIVKTEEKDGFPKQREIPNHVTDSPVSDGKRPPAAQEQSQVTPNAHPLGECRVGMEQQTVNQVPTESHDRELYALSHQATQSSSFPTMNPNLSIPQNFSLQQISVLSQQMIAAMLSLQRLQQSNAASATLGNLLPPPPNLGSTIDYQAPSQNIAFSEPPGSTVHRQGVSSTSNQSLASQSFNGSPPDSQENELPLDLSKPTKSLVQNQSSTTSTTKRQYDANSLASIRSNFPTLLLNKASNAKKRKSSDSPPPLTTSLPSTSTLVSHNTTSNWTSSQASSETSNQVATSQMQLQNWLLAAMSVQKMQQIALGRSVLFQDSQTKQGLTNAAPRKRKLVSVYHVTKVSDRDDGQ